MLEKVSLVKRGGTEGKALVSGEKRVMNGPSDRKKKAARRGPSVTLTILGAIGGLSKREK